MNVKLFSSILDYPHPGLDPAVWGQDGKLLPEQKETILTRLNQNLKNAKLKHFDKWASYVHIVGSLTTYQYISTSDCDVHILVDIPKFIELENLGKDVKEVEANLDALRKEFFDDKAFFLKDTKHPVEFYFVTPKSSDDTTRVGVYDVIKDTWVKDPVAVGHDFDIEESKPKFIEEAAKMAGEIDISLGDIKRQILRIEELQETIKAWDSKSKKLFKDKLNAKLESVEKEIQELIDIKVKMVQTRHTEEFDAQSEDEIKFKYLQKFGYFYIITQLKELLEVTEDVIEVTEDKVPEIKEIVTTPEEKIAALAPEYHDKLMIDFDKTIAENEKDRSIGEPLPGVKEAFDKLKSEGWHIVIYSGRANTPEGVDEIREFMKKYNLPYDEIFIGKPIAEYYIDDRNIVFTNWKDVVKTIDKAPKKTAQHNVEYDFSSTHFVLPKDIAQKIVEWSVENIPNDDLHDDETNRYGRELESHITVLFGLLTNDSKEVEKILKDEKPVRVKFKKTKVFENDMDAIFIEVDSEDVERLHKKLKELDNEDQQPNYHPHCTVAYVKSGLGKKYAGEDILDGLELELDIVKFSPKEGDPIFITLGGKSDKEASKSYDITHGYWIAPDGEVFEADPSHADWALENDEMLLESYGIDLGEAESVVNDIGFEQMDSSQMNSLHSSVLDIMIGNGWVRALGIGSRLAIQINELHNPPAYVEDFFINQINNWKEFVVEDLSGESVDIIEPEFGFVKGIKQALRRGVKKSHKTAADKIIQVNNWGTIVKNPTADDAEELFNSSSDHQLRWGATGNRDLYIWNAASFTHHAAASYLGFNFGYQNMDTGYLESVESARDWANRFEKDRYYHNETVRKDKAASMDIVASFISKKAKLHWFTPGGDTPHVVDPQEFQLKPEVYQEYLNKGYIAIDDQSSPPRVLVWDFETTPDWLDRYLNDKIGYGDVVLTDRGGRSFPVHIPTKNIKRQIQRELYRPDNINASFMPSITQAPDNHWTPDSDVEIPVDPDTMSEEETSNKDFLVDKPKKGLWKSILDMFTPTKKASVKKDASAARGWLDPKGKFYNFGNFNYSDWQGVTHDDWAQTNETMLYDQYGISLDTEINPTSQLIENGWIRISDDHHKLGVHLLSLMEIPDFLESHLLQTMGPDTPVTVEEADGAWVEVTDWHTGLQKAVNKELQRKRMMERQRPAVSSLKTAYLEHAYWIAPDNKVFTVRKAGTDSKYTHGSWAKRNRIKLNQLYNLEIGSSWDAYQATEYLIDDGWVRIGDAQSGKGWAVMLLDVHSIPSAVDNVLTEFLQDGDVVAVESLSSGDYIEVQYPWRSLQNEVNRQYRAQNQNKEVPIPAPEETPEQQPEPQVQPAEPMQEAASLSKEALDFKFWISPKGEYFKVHGIHLDWIIRNWKDLGFDKRYGVSDVDAIEDVADRAYDEMISDGWARVTIGDSSVQFMVTVSSVTSLPSAVESFVEEYFDSNAQKGVWFNDYDGNNVLVDDPIGNLQEKITYELRHRLDNRPKQREQRVAASRKNADVLTDILKIVKDTGGATYNFSTHTNLAGTANYAVSIYPQDSMIVDHDLTVHDLYTYITSKRDLLLQPENSLGIWNNSGKYYLDVSLTIPDKEKAIELGKKHNQISIFDLQNFQEIPTGGTGEVPKQSALTSEFWFDPSGKQYPVKNTHKDWMVENQKLLRDKYGINIGGTAPFIEMLKQGWVRVGAVNKASDAEAYQFVMQVYDINKIPDFMNDFVVQTWNPNLKDDYGVPGIAVENFDGSDDIIIDNPFPTLQKAVRKTMREWSKAASLGLSKYASSGRYWIDPNGKVYNVPGTHTAWVGRNAEKLNKQFGYNLPLGVKVGHEYTDILIDNGWVRIADDWAGNYQMVIDVNDFKNIPSTVDNFIAEHFNPNLKRPIIVGSHSTVLRSDTTVIVNDPFPTLQEAVNEELRRPKMASLGLSKYSSYEGAAWVDPKGKIYKVTRSHDTWLEGHVTMLEAQYGYHLPDNPLVHNLLDLGWTRVAYWAAGEGGVQIGNLENVPPGLQPFIDENYNWESGNPIIVEDSYNNYAEVDVTGNIQDDISRSRKRRQTANLEKTAFSAHALWIAPDKQIYEVRGKETGRDMTHAEWIEKNRGLLQKKYKIRLPKDLSGEESFDINSILIEKGWIRIGDYHGSQVGIRLLDIHSIPSIVEDVLASFAKEGSAIHIEDLYQNEWATVTYPFKSLQNEVNRFIQEMEQKHKKREEVQEVDRNKARQEREQKEQKQQEEQKRLEQEQTRNVPIPETVQKEIKWKQPEQMEVPLTGTYESPSTGVNNTEPFSPLPTTFTTDTNDDNLNSRYPWKFMKKPSGPDYSNEGEVDEILVDDESGDDKEMPLSKKHAELNAIARSDFAAWIDPNGKIYTIRANGSGGTHLGWLETNIDVLRKEYNYEMPRNSLTSQRLMELYELMLKDGWIRIGDSLSRDVGISIQLRNLRDIPSYVDDYLATFYEDGMKVEIEEGGTYTTQGLAVSLDNPFPTLQKAVNKALVSKLPLAANLNIDAFSQYGFWVAPDGQAYDVRQSGSYTHLAWIEKNMRTLKTKYGISTKIAEGPNSVAVEMLQKGWVRIGDTQRAKGMVGVQVGNIKNLPSYIDDALATFMTDGQPLIVADLSDNWAEVTYPFKSLQNAVRRALRGSVPSESQKNAGNESNTYTDDQMEQIYDEQHAEDLPGGDGSGGNVYHDWNKSTTDFPKPEDTQRKQKIQLDLLEPTQTPPIASYEVTWYFGSPADDNGSM